MRFSRTQKRLARLSPSQAGVDGNRTHLAPCSGATLGLKPRAVTRSAYTPVKGPIAGARASLSSSAFEVKRNPRPRNVAPVAVARSRSCRSVADEGERGHVEPTSGVVWRGTWPARKRRRRQVASRTAQDLRARSAGIGAGLRSFRPLPTGTAVGRSHASLAIGSRPIATREPISTIGWRVPPPGRSIPRPRFRRLPGPGPKSIGTTAPTATGAVRRFPRSTAKARPRTAPATRRRCGATAVDRQTQWSRRCAVARPSIPPARPEPRPPPDGPCAAYIQANRAT